LRGLGGCGLRATVTAMGDEMTIDELARRSGVTSRNVRAYQERGLLPSPVLRGRVGYYGDAHLARLRHIGQLAQRGFSLASIRELFRAWEHGWGLADVLGFEQALAAPWQDESDQILTTEQLTQIFGGTDETIARAASLGLLELVEPDRYRVTIPRLLQAGAELVQVGVPLAAVLDEAEVLQSDMRRIAERFVNLFLEHVWQPYVDRGMPPGDLSAVTEALQRLRPVAGTAVETWLAAAMERQIDAVTAETLAIAPFGGQDERGPAEEAGAANRPPSN
jgi:DNA-binding transcriptional MerR regulator